MCIKYLPQMYLCICIYPIMAVHVRHGDSCPKWQVFDMYVYIYTYMYI